MCGPCRLSGVSAMPEFASRSLRGLSSASFYVRTRCKGSKWVGVGPFRPLNESSTNMSSNFVKYDLGQVGAGTSVAVTLTSRANVRLLDVGNFERYRRGESFRAIGGEAVRSPVRLSVPSDGHWYVVLDLGGGSGTITSSVQVSR